MLHSILVPVDGSPSSEQAVSFAVRLAARDGARLDLVQVVEPIPLHAHSAPVSDPRLDYDLRREKARYLTRLAELIEAEHQVPVRASVEEGPVAETLARCATEVDADLVAMTTHHPVSIGPAWLSSTADALVRKVDIPVLVVRPVEGRALQADAFPPRGVLVLVDGSGPVESILDAALAVGGNDASYVVAGTDTAPANVLTGAIFGIGRDAAADLQERVLGYLDEVARQLGGRRLRVETKILQGPDLAAAILDYANAYRADLIAMATPGHNLEERVIAGTVAEDVMRGTSVPVLVRRPARPTRTAVPTHGHAELGHR